MDASTASVISGLGAAALVAATSIIGIALNLKANREQQDRSERAQARRDDLAQQEIRNYRNHDRRIHAAADYVSALNAFRRGVKVLNPSDSNQADEVTADAQAAEDARALLTLYFSKSVGELARKASQLVADMHDQRRGEALEGHDMERQDNDAKVARDDLINAMKHQLGEPDDSEAQLASDLADTRPGVSRS